MTHWAEKYVGREYRLRDYDCASLVCDVEREQFAKDVPDFGERPPSRSEGYEMLLAEIDKRLVDSEQPEEGDIVDVLARGDFPHVGVYCVVDGAPAVLHNTRKHGVIITPLAEMSRYGWRVQRILKWT